MWYIERYKIIKAANMIKIGTVNGPAPLAVPDSNFLKELEESIAQP